MTSLDATTPQLKALKDLTDALVSNNLDGAEPPLSKNFTFRTFPKVEELPDLKKDGYLQMCQAIFTTFSKTEASTLRLWIFDFAC